MKPTRYRTPKDVQRHLEYATDRLRFLARNKTIDGSHIERSQYVISVTPLNAIHTEGGTIWANNDGSHHVISPDIFEFLFSLTFWLQPGQGVFQILCERRGVDTFHLLGEDIA